MRLWIWVLWVHFSVIVNARLPAFSMEGCFRIRRYTWSVTTRVARPLTYLKW